MTQSTGTRGIAPSALVLISALVIGLVVGTGAERFSVEFLVTSLIVVVAPGTGVVYTIASSVAGGWARGLLAAIGCTFGIVPHVVAAILGLSGIMQAGAVAFEIIRWAGVAYLAFLGISMILQRGSLRIGTGEDSSPASGFAVVRKAILLNLLNPKLTLFFFAFLPQFLDSPPTLLDRRLIGLSTAFMFVTLIVFLGYALIAAAVRRRMLGKPKVVAWVQRLLGLALVGFATRLAVTDR